MLHAVIMAGGSGTRFWPASRARRPKQLLSLVTGAPLLVDTARRLDGLVDPARVRVITNAAYAEQSRAMLPELPADNVIAEPCGRDTAACIALAAALVAEEDPDGVMAVLPADHVVDPASAFRAALARAAGVIAAAPETLVTFGIHPTRAATGYGYIERGVERGRVDGVPYYAVASFREKPDAKTALEFVESGRFFWNGGIFVFRAAAFLRRVARHLPEMSARLPRVLAALRAGRLDEATYALLPRISVDYGILEKDDDVTLLEASFGWDDVGSFAALERVLVKGADGNCGRGERIALDAEDNIALGGSGHLIALLGVRGLIVAHTPDVTLVCRKQDAERVKELVARLHKDGREDVL